MAAKNVFLDKRFEKVKDLLEQLESDYDIDKRAILQLASFHIPVSIFDSSLSGFEAIVKFLKENRSLGISEIAALTKRSKQCVWLTYRNASEKYSRKLPEESEISFPLSVISSTSSVLESIVRYLHEEKELKFSEIANLIHRDQRTIWTVYNRALKKRNR